MGVFRKFLSVVFLFLITVSFSRCILPECQDLECPDGESCILEDNVAVCSGSSSGTNTNTGNAAGETCSVDADCATGLVCQPDLDGLDVCTAQ